MLSQTFKHKPCASQLVCWSEMSPLVRLMLLNWQSYKAKSFTSVKPQCLTSGDNINRVEASSAGSFSIPWTSTGTQAPHILWIYVIQRRLECSDHRAVTVVSIISHYGSVCCKNGSNENNQTATVTGRVGATLIFISPQNESRPLLQHRCY